MTEEEWLKCGAPIPMLEFLRRKASDRKLRLFAVACCCNAVVEATPKCGELLQDLRVVEQIAEGLLPNPKNDLDHYRFCTIFHGSGGAPELACHAAASAFAWDAAFGVVKTLDDALWDDGDTNCGANFLREIFGNPFRSVSLAPAWRTSTVVTLAEGMYESRDFGAMPILADALQDAGCDNQDVLNHCRDTKQTHVRGCWVIDLVLGRS
jgi:hypothetical protein